mgnify:CR=1 FL=1
MGVGGDDSWGAPVHEAYWLKADKPLELNFTLVPKRAPSLRSR